MIQTDPTPTQARYQADHTARRNRWAGMAVAARRPAPVAPVEPEIYIAPTSRPLWKRGDIVFNAHIIAWHRHVAESSSPVTTYIKRRAEELGVTFHEIIGERGIRRIARARQQIMWEIRQEFPTVSFPQIGRLFGGRDHTTVLHAVKKIERERGQG